MPRGDYLKYSLESIYEQLESKGYKWIGGEYINRESKIVIEKDGFIGLALIGTLMDGADVKFFFSKNPYTIENIRLWISENTNYKLISNEYVNAYTPLTFKCDKHGLFKLSWNKIFQGRTCQKCSVRNKKYSINEINIMLQDINENIEVLSDEYINCFSKMKFRCKIDGNIWFSSWHNILANNNGCPECKRISFLGENNPRYNPNLTEHEREIGRNYSDYFSWRTDIFIKYNYTCQNCNTRKGSLNAHHLNGYDWCIEERTDIDNGVLLCESCHKEFHSIYGWGKNTKEQYYEWINNKTKFENT